jgi:hypothetical protein
VHLSKIKFAVAAAVAAGACGLGAVAASAAVSPAPVVSTTGTGGYDEAVGATGPGFTNVQTVASPNQYGTTVKTGAAAGGGLCATAGRTELLGLVATSANSYKVEYANGNAGPGHCPVDHLLPSPVLLNSALANIPSTHSVWLSVNYGVHRFIRFGRIIIIGRAGAVTFSAQDVTGTPGPIYTHTVFISPVRFTHADLGVIEDANLIHLQPCASTIAPVFPAVLTGPAAYTTGACQPVADFNYATKTIGNVTSAFGSGVTVSEGISGPGTVTSPALVAPNNTLNTAPGASTGPHGSATAAATAGGHFTMYTGDIAP